ncbi:hypothetical protein [Microbacterium sp. BWT-B31]|uniref:hypothetical protein n=1 Tax=Microbacterium sp. BWT-B31 TaxID=3232072 RepID=UPI00352758BC
MDGMLSGKSMLDLSRALRDALRGVFGEQVSGFRVLEHADGDRAWLAYRFVLYDFSPIVFTYDRGAFGFGEDHGNVVLPVLTSTESAPGLDDLTRLMTELDRRVRLRIPDKYLADRGVGTKD